MSSVLSFLAAIYLASSVIDTWFMFGLYVMFSIYAIFWTLLSFDIRYYALFFDLFAMVIVYFYWMFDFSIIAVLRTQFEYRYMLLVIVCYVVVDVIQFIDENQAHASFIGVDSLLTLVTFLYCTTMWAIATSIFIRCVVCYFYRRNLPILWYYCHVNVIYNLVFCTDSCFWR